jgi:hypothetical protein
LTGLKTGHYGRGLFGRRRGRGAHGRLRFGDGFVEGFAGAGVFDGFVEGALCEADGLRGYADAAAVEGGEGDFEAGAFFA